MNEAAEFVVCDGPESVNPDKNTESVNPDDVTDRVRKISKDGSLLIASRLTWAYYWFCKNPENREMAKEFFGIFSIVRELFDFESEGSNILEILLVINEKSTGAGVISVTKNIAKFICGESC